MFKPSLKALLSFSLIFALVFVVTTPSSATIAKKKEPKKNADRQTGEKDQKAVPVKEKVEITVTAPRVEILLKQNPAATTVVETQILQTMPRSIAIDEAMKLVPGVKVDNQAGGERVHLSIRGQGILTERGTRGVKTLVDGLPLNDPSGFISDFFDIDWATVSRIEVLRGPAAAFYGSGSSGGILNILTRDGGSDPISGAGFLTGGSYGFFKGLVEILLGDHRSGRGAGNPGLLFNNQPGER